jgi:hypothetical protein
MFVSISYLVYGALYSVHPAVDSLWKQSRTVLPSLHIFHTLPHFSVQKPNS